MSLKSWVSPCRGEPFRAENAVTCAWSTRIGFAVPCCSCGWPPPSEPGKKRAIVAIGRSILVIIWALLSDTDAQFVDLGSDYYATRNNPERKARHHIRELNALGYTVTLNPAA